MAEFTPPGGLPPEMFASNATHNTPPQSVRRIVIIITGLVIVLALLVAIGFGFIYLLRGSTSDETATPTPTPIPTIEVSSPTVRPIPVLHVQVQRKSDVQFNVEILSVRRTYDIPTIYHQEPPVGNTHSLIQLRSTTGALISEFRFSFPTQVMLEGAGDPGVLFDVPVSPLDLYLPVPDEHVPGSIRVVTPDGRVLVEQTVNYSELPVGKQPTSDPGVQSWLQRLHLFQEALAQQAGPAQKIKIVVVNHKNANIFAAQAAVQTMVTSISPWPLFSPNVEVESVVLNNQDLGCQLFTVGPNTYPLCTNSGAVLNAVQQQVQDVDLVAVAVDVNCDCGGSVPNSKIVALGSAASSFLAAHEFAHAIPTFLADEYLGDQGRSGPGGPNCFGSKIACETALGSVGVGFDQCRQGCNNPGAWRSESQLMYNVFTGFGPVDHRLMCEHIADLVGLDCADVTHFGIPTSTGGPISTIDPGTIIPPGPGPTSPGDPGPQTSGPPITPPGPSQPPVPISPSSPPGSCFFCAVANCPGACVCSDSQRGSCTPPVGGTPQPSSVPYQPTGPNTPPRSCLFCAVAFCPGACECITTIKGRCIMPITPSTPTPTPTATATPQPTQLPVSEVTVTPLPTPSPTPVNTSGFFGGTR